MANNPFADLIPKSAGSDDNPFADLIPEAPPAAPQKTIGDFLTGNTDAFASNAYRTLAGVGEAGLSLLTGLGAFPVSKVGGVFELIRNINDPRATEKAKEFEEFLSQYYTYQPRTDLGKDLMEKTGRLVMEPFFGLMKEMGETPARDVMTNPLLMAATGGRSAEYVDPAKYIMGTAAEFVGPVVASQGVAAVKGYLPETRTGVADHAPGMKLTPEQTYRKRLMEDFRLLDEQIAKEVFGEDVRSFPEGARAGGSRQPNYPEGARAGASGQPAPERPRPKASMPSRKDISEAATDVLGMRDLEAQAGRLEGRHIDRQMKAFADRKTAEAEAEAERARIEGYQDGEAAAAGRVDQEIPTSEPATEAGPDNTRQAIIPGAGLMDTFGLTGAPGEHGGKLPEGKVPEQGRLEITKKKSGRGPSVEEMLVRQDPIYNLMAETKKNGGINMGSLLRDYDIDTVKQLHKRFPGIVQKKGKIKLDTLAQEYGYESGDVLLNAMLDSPSVKVRARQLKEQFANSAMGQELELAKKGFTKAPVEGIVAGDLKKGDQVLIGGERYKVHGEKGGSVILKDGKTIEEEKGYNASDEEVKTKVAESQAELDLSPARGQADISKSEPLRDGSVLHAPALEAKQVGDYKTHTTKINSIQDVAEIAAANGAHLAKEHLTAIITDADGNIVRVYRHSVGSRGEATFDAGELAGNLLNTPDGQTMYLVHNHPAGRPELSDADIRALEKVRNLVRDTGKQVANMIATTPDHYGTLQSDTVPLQKPEMKSSVPILERVYKDRGKSPLVTNQETARNLLMRELGDKDGILITDNSGRACAIISVRDIATLRGDVAMSVARVIDQTNGSNIFVHSARDLTQPELMNIQRFANAADLRFMDAYTGPDRRDLRSRSALYKQSENVVRGVSRGEINFYANPLVPAIKGLGTMIKNWLDNRLVKSMPGYVRNTGETFGHLLRRTVQDSKIAIRDFEQTIEKTYNVKISAKESTYYTWDRLHGKVSEHIAQFQRGIVEPFVKQMAEVSQRFNTNLDEFDLYLKAKYAPTRNEIIAKRNPELAALGPGSGMSNAEAANILAIFNREGKTAAFEQLAKIIYQVQDMKLQLIEKYGLESNEVIAAMKATHGRYYVPLKGKPGIESGTVGNTLNVRSSGLRAAIGRLSPSENAVVHTFNDFEATVRRVHNNEVTKSFLDIAEKYQPKGIEINKVQLKQRYNPDTGQVETFNSPVGAPEENTIACIRMVKDKSGKDVPQHVFIRINDNPLLVRALKSEQIGFGMADQVISKIGGVTRTIAGLCTKWSPEFWMTNFQRDIGDALQGIASEHKATVVKDVIKNVGPAMKAMYDYYRGKPGGGPMDATAREFVQNGGTVGFYSGKDFEARARDLERQIRLEARSGAMGMTARTAKGVFDFIGDVTAAGENAVRLSVYKALREHGKGIEESIAYAKNVTVNFNRHGEHRWISQLYMFANPSIQGIHRFAQVAGTKKGMAIMTGILATSMAVSEANRMIAGEDEDGINRWDKISTWEKCRNLIIMRPNSDKPLLKIPLGFYARLPFGTGNAIADIAHGTKDPLDAGATMIDTTLDAFNPLGSGSVAQSLMPTIGRPFLDIGVNRNAFGQPFMPEQGFGPKKPDSQLAFGNVTPVSKWIAESLNTATGGSTWESGAIDVSPASIDYVVKFYTGGPGKNVQQLIKIGTSFWENGGNIKAMSEELTAQDIPFVGRITGSRTEYQTQQKFYEVSGKAEAKYAEYKGRKKADVGFEEFDEKYGAMAWVGKQTNKYREKLTRINEEIRAIQEDTTMDKAVKKEMIKEYEKEKTELMKEYIRDYNEANKQRKAYKPKQAGGWI